jgi:hypothetical protein
MSNLIPAERLAYFSAIREMVANEQYVDLLAFEGQEPNSAEFKRKAFAHYQPTAHDIIVTTYPKSGTNWTMQIAQQIAWLGESTYNFIHDVIPWPDSLMKTPVVSLDAELEPSPTGYRVIKSHLEAAYIPVNDKAKYIVVMRDPKEVVVSGFHFQNGFFEKMVGASVPLWAYVDGFVSNRFVYASWADHTAGWWQLRQRPNVLILYFHEMKSDTNKAIDQIATFLNVKLTTEQHAIVAEKSSHSYMKANNHLFSPPAPADYQTQGQIDMVRSGQAGQSGQILTPAQQAQVDRFSLDECARLSSDFPYRQTFMHL